MRDPNFITPTRSPTASSSPTCTRHTTRRASRPTTCRKIAVRPWWSTQTSDCSLRAPLSGRYAGRNWPALYDTFVTRPETGARFTCTSRGDRKIVTCCQVPGGASGPAGPTAITLPSAGERMSD